MPPQRDSMVTRRPPYSVETATAHSGLSQRSAKVGSRQWRELRIFNSLGSAVPGSARVSRASRKIALKGVGGSCQIGKPRVAVEVETLRARGRKEDEEDRGSPPVRRTGRAKRTPEGKLASRAEGGSSRLQFLLSGALGSRATCLLSHASERFWSGERNPAGARARVLRGFSPLYAS